MVDPENASFSVKHLTNLRLEYFVKRHHKGVLDKSIEKFFVLKTTVVLIEGFASFLTLLGIGHKRFAVGEGNRIGFRLDNVSGRVDVAHCPLKKFRSF
jgi:hypothetical protein